MGRFRADEVDNYGGSGGGGYFSLKDDGDAARVRFMYNGIDDLEGYAVHEVEIDGRKRYVNCLRDYNSPIDDCPFCRERNRQVAKLFIPVYNVDEDKMQVWERGKKYFAKMTSLISRYANADTPFCAQMFDIERHGKKGDTATQYEIYPVGTADKTTLDDLPERPVILGGLVLDKTADDMEYFLEAGYFPPEDQPARRRGRREDAESSGRSDSREERSERRSYRDVGRRTPNRRGEDF